jgi:hypothetical protein
MNFVLPMNWLLMEIEEIARLVVDCGVDIHKQPGPDGKQVLTYLRLLNLPLGLLRNFGAAIFKSGFKRIVNNHSDFAASRLRLHQGLI